MWHARGVAVARSADKEMCVFAVCALRLGVCTPRSAVCLQVLENEANSDRWRPTDADGRREKVSLTQKRKWIYDPELHEKNMLREKRYRNLIGESTSRTRLILPI